jgi:hypothetical protein
MTIEVVAFDKAKTGEAELSLTYSLGSSYKGARKTKNP